MLQVNEIARSLTNWKFDYRQTESRLAKFARSCMFTLLAAVAAFSSLTIILLKVG